MYTGICMVKKLFFPVDDCQPIAQRENQFVKSRVGGYLVVEVAEGDGLLVAVVGRVDDVPVPEGVICQQPAADRQELVVH